MLKNLKEAVQRYTVAWGVSGHHSARDKHLYCASLVLYILLLVFLLFSVLLNCLYLNS